MGLCLEKVRSQRSLMSHNNNTNNNRSTKHVKKKAKQDVIEQQSNNLRHSYRQTNTTLEPRRDLPLHKIPELLAKITGTLSSTLSSSVDTKQSSSSSQSTSNSFDRRLQLFKQYSNDEIMSIDGILHLCNDLSIEPDCYEVLLFCFLCRAKQMYSLTKDEFLLGLKTLGNHVDNISDLRTILLNYNVSSYENEFYIWTYHYGLIDGQRCVITQNAISLWRLFYSKNIEKPKIFDRWLNYLEQDINNEIPKTITCDTWTIFPQFAKFIELNGYEAYDDNEAWPCLFDGFVENELSQQQQQQQKDMSKPTLKKNLKPLEFDATSNIKNGKHNSDLEDINPIPRPVSSGSNHRDLSTGKLHLSNTQIYKFTSNDLIDRGVIGEGNFGIVCKMEHEKSGTMMAVKRIRSTVDERCQKQMLNELDIVMRENACPYIVQFYGALFKEGDCWICMELMDTSLDRFYKYVYHKLDQSIPESVLSYITLATLQALDYIKSTWKIIHRDVKPSNILVSRKTIKLCDFGISGQLIDSIAKTRDAGCRPYLPPERIDPLRAARDGYDVRSDVWSLGITIYEIATGYFPFREWTSVFDQLQQIIEGPPLQLTIDRLSTDCQDFVNTCLNKDENQRPKYKKLLEHPFVQKAKGEKQAEHTAVYLSEIIDGLQENTDTFELYYYLPSNSSASSNNR